MEELNRKELESYCNWLNKTIKGLDRKVLIYKRVLFCCIVLGILINYVNK